MKGRNRFFISLAFFALLLPAGAIVAQDSTHAERPILRLDPFPASGLSWSEGVFGHTFGTNGWPDGVSPYGRDPNSVRLRVGPLDMGDLFTGRPRFDLTPVSWLGDLSFGFGDDSSVQAGFDSLNWAVPMTDLRYQSAGSGSQAVRVLHVQNRTYGPDSTARRLQTAFGYGGEGARGEYDGARLRRAREITARIRYDTPSWSIELFEMAQRRSVEAHTGVIPFSGAGFESIYQRLGARVGDESARRKTLRNDMYVRGSSRFGSVTGVWTVQTLDFKGETASEKGVMSRFSLELTQTTTFRGQPVDVVLRTWNDSFQRGTAFADGVETKRTFSSVLFGTSGSYNTMDYSLRLGPESGDSRIWGSFWGTATAAEGPFAAKLSISRRGKALAWHEVSGFGSTLVRSAFKARPMQQSASVSLSWRAPLFSAGVTAYLQSDRDLLVTRMGTESVLAGVDHLPGSSRATGMSITLGFREEAARGLYALINPVSRSARTDATSRTARAWRSSMPTRWIAGRVGMRARIFSDDMDLNAYVRARYWGEMGGLRLHTPTGLLVLPNDTGERVASNWLVDFVAEAGIRGATIFLAYENAFSGTDITFGNLIIPNYPLPQQRTRFGVFWPISN